MRHSQSSFTKVVMRWASKSSSKPRIWSRNGCENARRPAHCISSHVPSRLRTDDSLHHQPRATQHNAAQATGLTVIWVE
jgi:hypothetical protein